MPSPISINNSTTNSTALPERSESILLPLAEMAPSITGRAAAVIETPCQNVLYNQNAHQRLAPASLTKIATALVADERTNFSDVVDINVDGPDLMIRTDSTVMGLEPGQRLAMQDLIYGLLLPSGNDAAIAIAEHVSGNLPDFATLMNDLVARLGLNNTNFSNPHGLDDPNLYSSAFDMAVLSSELLAQPSLASVVQTRSYQPDWEGPEIWNLNRLADLYPDSIGVKIGYTDEAKQTITAGAERDGRQLVVSVLGSDSLYTDAIALLNWAYANTSPTCT